MINNVENVLLQLPLAGQYSVTVVGRGVNVNAVTAQMNNNVTGTYAPNVVQDYALVISVGEGEVTNAFTVLPATGSDLAPRESTAIPTGDQNITIVTSTNTPLFDQFVGASSPLLGTNNLPLGTNTVWGPNGIVTIGQTNQWHFYIVTNTGMTVDYTNAAFITFQSSTLSIPRMGVFDPLGISDATRPEADIDLFVSQNPALTNLNPVVHLQLSGRQRGWFRPEQRRRVARAGRDGICLLHQFHRRARFITSACSPRTRWRRNMPSCRSLPPRRSAGWIRTATRSCMVCCCRWRFRTATTRIRA